MASADTVQVVRSLTSWIRAQCADIDSARAVPSAVIDELRRAGVFRMLAPRDFDGSETDPAAFFDVVEETSYADGSVGWIVMIAGGYAALGGLLARQAAAEILGNPSTILVGAFKPAGTAVQVDGGYRVDSGRSAAARITQPGSSQAAWSSGTTSRCRHPAADPSCAR
jgi:3-hydroxy-9,10-secoandrosta-1,3,5(10)-triene-9,17-dione monooxygenase